jgi:uracil-DNA glycosylase family 4
MTIDWEALVEVQDGSHGWRSAFPELSNVYVPGEGDNPLVMIIGEAPGAQEEIKRRPFVGAAGNVLRQLMGIAGLYSVTWPEAPANCWLTNVVKFRPPRNRKPTPMEIQAARPWLKREWAAIGKPRLLIAVGSTALEALTGKRYSILKVAGKPQCWPTTQGNSIWIWPMVHPSFGLRNKQVQPLLEQDWLRLSSWITNKDNSLSRLPSTTELRFSHAED